MDNTKSELEHSSPEGNNQSEEVTKMEVSTADCSELRGEIKKSAEIVTDEQIENMLKSGLKQPDKEKPQEPRTNEKDQTEEHVHLEKQKDEQNLAASKAKKTNKQQEENTNKDKKFTSKMPKNCLQQIGKLCNSDRSQYIKRRNIDNYSNGMLPYSGRFWEGKILWRLYGENGLLTTTNKYVAQVAIERVDELDRAITFNSAKQILMKNLKVVKVLLDEHSQEMQNTKQKYEEYSKKVFTKTIDNLQNAEDLFQLLDIVSNVRQDDRTVVAEIRRNAFICETTKKVISEYIELDSKNKTRIGFFSKIQSFFNASKQCSSLDVLRNVVQSGIRNHKAKSLEMSPEILKCYLEKLHDKRVLFVTRQDLKLFSDLVNTLDQTVLKSMFPDLSKRYYESIVKLNANQITSVLPITNHIFYYLCKSLLDLSEEIATKTSNKDMLIYDVAEGWRLTEECKWKSTPSTMDKSLEQQIKLLLKLSNHFEIGRNSSRQRFPYEFMLFRSIESNPEYHQAIEKANEAFGRQGDKNGTVLPDELRVWICLLDDAIGQSFVNDQHIIKLCSALLKLYLNYSLSGQLTIDSLESLRVITHNTIRFVAQAGPFVNPQNDQDNDIVLKQIDFMNRASHEGRISFADYRDLIEVFAQYWRQRSDTNDGFMVKLTGKYIKEDVEEIQSLLLQCMSKALDKNAELIELINFYRIYEELLTDLYSLPLDWFVRMPSSDYTDIFIKKGLISVVENKWKHSDRQCYFVKDFEQFEKVYLELFDKTELQRNFHVKTIAALVKCIVTLAEKKFRSNNNALTQSEQLKATGLLITSVRSSFLYLKEQPDYTDFDRFLEESTKPFTTVCNESSSFGDFEKRILLIKESFWYIRNQNAIGIDTALELYKGINKSDINEEQLRFCFNKYSKQFEHFMGIDIQHSTSSKIQRIVEETLKIAEDSPASQWQVDFKHEKLPVILAGLGAVWALHVSKDVASTGQYLKPHCIQILCVFRLLSADRADQGVRKHLAQVLTGQGKSLVLAMVASVLALCGHSVQIMCYSEYLATREEQDFKEYYDYFEIRSEIMYQTFEEAAGEQFKEIAGNAQKYVHKSIGLPEAEISHGIKRLNPVLLIDEVDVFFDEKFYGETKGLLTCPHVPGLDKIQRMIWKLVCGNCSNIRQTVNNFLNNCGSDVIVKFNKLMRKYNQYSLLIRKDSSLRVEMNSNYTLFSKHIDDMISTAKHVAQMKSDDSYLNKFWLNSTGNITLKNCLGGYSENTYHGYYNTFIFFRLKKINFKEGPTNYGYFNFLLGSTSYAKLPERYPLVLGVSSILTTLSNYEKKVVKDRYNIGELSVMPSFFGGSNLKFNESTDFACFDSIAGWMIAIFGRINAMVYAKRSVLVIFDTDVTIDAFRRQFAGQLDRLNVLTVDTSSADKERFITDAGVSRTITLATREMGRGVDYKSSVSVEKNGGVHVIQSFFSVDVKEETQIKGRTARKDNRGSYELIVCIEDLRKEGLVSRSVICSTVSYSFLNTSRSWKMSVKNYARDEKLRKANENHDVTISF